MLNRLYIVHDTVAQLCFGNIIRATNDEVARRSFHDLIQQKDGPVAGHIGDYSLLYLGNMTEENGMISVPKDAIMPQVIATGQDWLDANKEISA